MLNPSAAHETVWLQAALNPVELITGGPARIFRKFAHPHQRIALEFNRFQTASY